jgi:hypothetical protein
MRSPCVLQSPLRQLVAVAACLVLCSLLTTVHAGMRGRGKYSGVVIFDRWDTCFLLSGPYITYISEAVKEGLRSYAGQAIQIDATEITQPMNPGDGLVRSYVILGQAPDDPSDPIANKVEIQAEPAFDGKSAPIFDITVRNISLERVSVSPTELGPTLLGISRGVFSSASDGKSVAWITRADLVDGTSWSSTVDGKTTAYANYKVAQPCAFKDRVELAAYESVSYRVRLDVPTGEYQFMAGYGGGVHVWKSMVSNAISFNVDAAGVATAEP